MTTAPQRLRVPCGSMTFDALAAGPPTGECVLLLQGFPEFSEMWTSQLIALGEAGYRAVAVDQRGYSPDARPTDVTQYTVGHLASDVVAIADALDMDRFHLIGHDWGGMVAWTVASEYPARLRSLSVLSTPHPAALFEASKTGDQLKRLDYVNFFRQAGVAETALLANGAAQLRAAYAGQIEPDRVELFVERLSQPSALTGALSWYRALEPGFKAVPLAGRIVVPTLYIWGTGDLYLGPEAADATAAWVDAPYQFEALEDITHWINEQAPDQVNQLLLAHIGENH